jgi:threonine aldolase
VEAMHQRGWKFYTGVVTPDESRLMCSWDTTPKDVDGFAKDLKALAAKRQRG